MTKWMDDFEDLVYDKIQVENVVFGDHYVSISEHDFITVVDAVLDRYSQKYGVILISDENWHLLKSFPDVILIDNCVDESYARKCYMNVLEKFIDHVMSISEGYVPQ